MKSNLSQNPVVKKTSAVIILIILSIIFISFITGPKSNEDTTVKTTVSKVFDLNLLTGKNIDEVVGVLGQPSNDSEPTKLQKDMGTKEWEKTFKKDGYELLVTYYVDTRGVKDFFISTNDPSGATKDYITLIEVVGINKESNFMVKPVKTMKDPNLYTGVIFTPVSN